MLTVFCDLAVLLAAAEGANCPPALDDMPVLITYYDPASCHAAPSEDSGQAIRVIPNGNCDGDPAHFADSTPVLPESYGTTAACIPAWLGATVTIPGAGSWRCRDVGPAVEVAWNGYYDRWVIYLDVLAHEEPAYNYWLFEDWALGWR